MLFDKRNLRAESRRARRGHESRGASADNDEIVAWGGFGFFQSRGWTFATSC